MSGTTGGENTRGGLGAIDQSSASDLPDGVAAGDTTYYSGSSWVVRSIGNAGDVLTVSAGVPVWAAPAASPIAIPAGQVTYGNAGGTNITSSSNMVFTGNNNLMVGPAAVDVASTRFQVEGSKTVATGASAAWNAAYFGGTLTLTGTTQPNTAMGFVYVARPTVTDASVVTVGSMGSHVVANSPLSAGSATVRNAWSYYSLEGASAFETAQDDFCPVVISHSSGADAPSTCGILFQRGLGSFDIFASVGRIVCRSEQEEGGILPYEMQFRCNSNGFKWYNTSAATGGQVLMSLSGSTTATFAVQDSTAAGSGGIVASATSTAFSLTNTGGLASVTVGSTASGGTFSSALDMRPQSFSSVTPAAGFSWAAHSFGGVTGHTLTFSGTGQTLTKVVTSYFGPATITKSGVNTFTVTKAATAYFAGPPVGSSVTLTNAYTIWVAAGTTQLDGALVATSTASFSGVSTFTGAVLNGQRSDVPFSLMDAATIATDASLGNFAFVTLGGNRTMGAPTNPADGQTLTYVLTQDGTGSRTLAWNAVFVFSTDVPSPTLTTTASKYDVVAFKYSATKVKWLVLGVSKGYT